MRKYNKILLFLISVFLCNSAFAGVVQDTFTDIDGTLLESHIGDNGVGWVKFNSLADWDRYPPSNGIAYIKDNTVYATDYSAYMLDVIPPTANYSVEADLIALMTPLAEVGIAIRMNEGQDRFYLASYTRMFFDGLICIKKYDKGQFTTLGDCIEGLIFCNDFRNLRLKAEGRKLSLYINGIKKITVTDNASPITTKGKAGFFSANLALWDMSNAYRFDNFKLIASDNCNWICE